jgi:Fic family protein
MTDPGTYATRAGRYVLQPEGYRAFIPEPLPPSPPLRLTPALIAALSSADQALGRLDGLALTLPNPDLFVGMYVRKEAVLSSQIEGTQASLTDVLQFQIRDRGEYPADIGEVVNHVNAMTHGLSRLDEIPLSGRLVREIHTRLMGDARGAHGAGEFRRSQNWIGARGATLRSATFVPPPPHSVPDAMGALEVFWHERTLPSLIRAALAHAQFETIHPFIDGNGRMGRLLITFMLCSEGVLRRPLLYLSHHLKAHRDRYYGLLQSVRDEGRWEDWLEFFLTGVREVAEEAAQTATAIVAMREDHLRLLTRERRSAGQLVHLLDVLFQQPMVTVAYIQDRMGIRYPAANALVARLMDLSLLKEATGHRRNRRFLYEPYIDLFER